MAHCLDELDEKNEATTKALFISETHLHNHFPILHLARKNCSIVGIPAPAATTATRSNPTWLSPSTRSASRVPCSIESTSMWKIGASSTKSYPKAAWGIFCCCTRPGRGRPPASARPLHRSPITQSHFLQHRHAPRRSPQILRLSRNRSIVDALGDDPDAVIGAQLSPCAEVGAYDRRFSGERRDPAFTFSRGAAVPTEEFDSVNSALGYGVTE
jgi:hypothetical protein